MENENLEFFKLDQIDRKVLLWLLDHVPEKSVTAWIDYTASEYQYKKSILIDTDKLYKEITEKTL